MDEPNVPSPAGTSSQYDLLYRSFLNSDERMASVFAEVSGALSEIRQSIQRLGQEGESSSRFPGGRLVHRLFGRLMKRHLSVTIDALKDAEVATIAAIEKMSDIWDQAYRHEFEMERRSRSGVLDRLAVVDALQIRVELLEHDLARLRTSD